MIIQNTLIGKMILLIHLILQCQSYEWLAWFNEVLMTTWMNFRIPH